jgi:hypothetical protein
MSNEQKNQTAAPAAPAAAPAAAPSYETLLSMFVQSQQQIAQLLERQAAYNEEALKIAPRRKKSMEEYLKEKPRKRLLHEVYQNGRLVNPAGLSWDTIKLLDTLAPGTYAEGMVDVIRVKDGLNGVNSRIHIIYSNKHDAQRMEFNMRFPTFTKLVQTIAAEMAALGIKPVKDDVADPIEEIVEVAPRDTVKVKQQ